MIEIPVNSQKGIEFTKAERKQIMLQLEIKSATICMRHILCVAWFYTLQLHSG